MAEANEIERTLDALPDVIDFRDRLYSPALIEVPNRRELNDYRKLALPVLDQGREGACTGYALAATANYLLASRGRAPLADPVSARMLYIMARRYDEWPGEEYSGSSARGAMKGWHRHGVCAERLWKDATAGDELDPARSADAVARPLGAYYRVNHRDLVSMHAAIAEVGLLFATARVHQGWREVGPGDSEIVWRPGTIGGHAFAIVGYDRVGFWIQNSWGPGWGDGGFARLSYADWLANGNDVWVAALGVPVDLNQESSASAVSAPTVTAHASYVYARLRPHVIAARNDGELDPRGTYGLTREGLRSIVEEAMPAAMSGWERKRVALYAHGGLVLEARAIEQVEAAVEIAKDRQVYPLNFVWRSDFWSTLHNILRDAVRSRSAEGALTTELDFLMERFDPMIEVAARALGGKLMWDEMKENARGATGHTRGAARLTADLIAPMMRDRRLDEVHLVGHSAGAILMAELARHLRSLGVPIGSLTLWAPACTMDLFDSHLRPLIEAGEIERFALYTLDDVSERKDTCLDIYRKSLLYLVSRAFEENVGNPWSRRGERLLGLAEHGANDLPQSFWNRPGREWHVAPASPMSDAARHGAFDNDKVTLESTFSAIAGNAGAAHSVRRGRTLTSLTAERMRHGIEAALDYGGSGI